jgi:hypothetical protein
VIAAARLLLCADGPMAGCVSHTAAADGAVLVLGRQRRRYVVRDGALWWVP